MDVSVIIPTYNREEKLRECLESLFNQDYPQENFEIIVVDDGSTDGVKEMLDILLAKRPNLSYFFQCHRGSAAARNVGIKQAKAEIIGFTDDDCIVGRDWISKIVEAHRLEYDTLAIGGLTKVNSRNIKAIVSQSLSNGAIKANINGNKEIIFFPTCNVSLKKKYLTEEFNELFPLPGGEDLDFFWRFFKKGYKLIYNQDIEVLHNCHPNFLSFLKQAYRYGRGNYLVQHIHKDHPLLKEVQAKNNIFFFIRMIANFINIPRFSILYGGYCMRLGYNFTLIEKFKVYLFLTLHKLTYLIGSIIEHLKVKRSSN